MQVDSVVAEVCALHAACQNGHKNVVEFLIAHKANLELEVIENCQPTGLSYWHVASWLMTSFCLSFVVARLCTCSLVCLCADRMSF